MLTKLGVGQLYHISFNGKLAGVWDPEFNQKPDENHAGNEEWYPEPNLGRISVSDSIRGCFLGVFPNVVKFFKENKYPHMNFFVYSPVFKGDERVVTPGMLTENRMVWDAHVSQEYLILDEVQMKLVGEVEVKNTTKSKIAWSHPFNDPKEPLAEVGPEDVHFRWTRTYK